MKNTRNVIIASLIISLGIACHGYFLGKGMKESQPWHYLENPFELLENLEFPDNLELGFKAEPKRNGGNFKIRKDGKAYEGRVRGEDDREEISGELSFERIDLDDY